MALQNSLIWFLVFCLVWAPIAFYFGFLRPTKTGAWQHQAAFIVDILMLVPIISFVLFQQSGAIERLELEGFSAHSSIVESVGITNGTGAEPEWVFEAADSAEKILDYYRAPQSRPEWELTTDSKVMLILKRGEQRMTIGASDRSGYTSLMFRLSNAGDL